MSGELIGKAAKRRTPRGSEHMTEAKPVERRRGLTRYIVPHPAFRWYNERMATAALAAISISGLVSWLHQRTLFQALDLDMVVQRTGLGDAWSLYTNATLMVTLAAIATATFSVILVGFYLSHRMAGPVYQLREHMLAALAGAQPKQLQVRKGDQFLDVCETFNALMCHLGQLEATPEKRAAEAPERGDPLRLSTEPGT